MKSRSKKKKQKKAPSLLPYLKKWSLRLNLEGWRFQVFYGGPGTMDDDAQGEAKIYPEKREAHIFIRHPKHYNPGAKYDPIEWVLLHELIHVPINCFFVKQSQADWVLLERFIDDIADALFKQEYPSWSPY